MANLNAASLALLESNVNILLKNKSQVLEKLRRLARDGPGNVHIISDFDMTITKYWVNGKRNTSSHGLFMRWSGATEQFKRGQNEIFEKFYPIEVDPRLSEQEKLPHMITWWEESHRLIVELGVTRSLIRQMVQEHPLEFRTGITRLVELCERHSIPVLVFSAGIADVIDEILRQHQLFTPHMHVISNRMKFDESDNVVGFHDPLIHVFNKDEFTGLMMAHEGDVPSTEDPCHPSHAENANHQHAGNPNASAAHQTAIRQRRNVILIGDSVGDIRMGAGLPHDNILTIGLMNRFYRKSAKEGETVDGKGKWYCVGSGEVDTTGEAEHDAESFMNTFDVVLCGDMGFDEWLNKWMEEELLSKREKEQ